MSAREGESAQERRQEWWGGSRVTMTSLCNNCFGYQAKCPYIKLSLLRGKTEARIAVVDSQLDWPDMKTVLTLSVLQQVSLQREVTVYGLS